MSNANDSLDSDDLRYKTRSEIVDELKENISTISEAADVPFGKALAVVKKGAEENHGFHVPFIVTEQNLGNLNRMQASKMLKASIGKFGEVS